MSVSLATEIRLNVYANPNLLSRAVEDSRENFAERMAGDYPKPVATRGLPNGRVAGQPVAHFMLSDGTWNKPESQTNIFQLFNCAAQQTNTQRTVYFAGVGALQSGLERTIAGAFGIGLRRNIMAMYLDLVQNYEAGDEIVFSGYSRGAYTVRALAGMINKAGLLNRRKVVGWDSMTYEEKFNHVEVMFDFYKNKNVKPGDEQAKVFRKNFSHADAAGNVNTIIKGIGIFDTVGALGVPDANALLRTMKMFTGGMYDFYDTNISKIVRNCFHACAIDERRKTFPLTDALPSTSDSTGQRIFHALFRGEHYVGGGTPERKGLADIAAMWMAKNLKSIGVQFNDVALKDNFKPDIMAGVPVSVEGKKDILGFLGNKLRDFSNIKFGKFVHYSVVEAMRVDIMYRPKNIDGISTFPMT